MHASELAACFQGGRTECIDYNTNLYDVISVGQKTRDNGLVCTASSIHPRGVIPIKHKNSVGSEYMKIHTFELRKKE